MRIQSLIEREYFYIYDYGVNGENLSKGRKNISLYHRRRGYQPPPGLLSNITK